uniref:Uncharacterized protein n=2 Tax=Parascaris univalens TaxID=6257 RepID=A0A915ARM3_PARUN
MAVRNNVVTQIGIIRIVAMVTVSVFVALSKVVLEHCNVGDGAVATRHHDQWIVVYREEMCGYSAMPVFSFNNFKWALENAVLVGGNLTCEDSLDFVLPSLDTVRAIFTDRQKIDSTRALIVRNADTTYHYVIFEKPVRNRKVLRSDFALSLKDNKIIAVSKMSNGQVKLYRCASDQRSCSIDHKSALTISRRRSRVEKIILNENHLHALYYQYENKHYILSSVIIEGDSFSKVMVLRELQWDTIQAFALWDAHNGRQETFAMLGWCNESRGWSRDLAETYLVSEMASVEPQFMTYVRSDHIKSVSIQTVFVPNTYRPLTERELNGVIPAPQIIATTRYLESLAGIEPLGVYHQGYDTMEQKLRYHVDFANRMRKMHKLRTYWLYAPIRIVCDILPSSVMSHLLFNFIWWCHIFMWITMTAPFLFSTFLIWTAAKPASESYTPKRGNKYQDNKRKHT